MNIKETLTDWRVKVVAGLIIYTIIVIVAELAVETKHLDWHNGIAVLFILGAFTCILALVALFKPKT